MTTAFLLLAFAFAWAAAVTVWVAGRLCHQCRSYVRDADADLVDGKRTCPRCRDKLRLACKPPAAKKWSV